MKHNQINQYPRKSLISFLVGGTWIRVSRRISGQWWRIVLRMWGERILARWRHNITLGVQYRFDDEVKDDTHGVFCYFHPRNGQDFSRNVDIYIPWRCYRQMHGLPLFSELVWFAYKVLQQQHVVVVWGFYWHSKKVSGPPLCPSRLTKRRTYRPHSVIYRYVSRQSSEKWFKSEYSSYPLSILRGQLNKWYFIRKGKLPEYGNFPVIFQPVL